MARSISQTESEEISYETIEVSQKTPAKRESNTAPRQPRNLSTRAHFYNLLMNIVDTLQESAKNDIRRAKEKELQRGSVV